jgi:uncharacterized protein (DUF58 family)
VTSRGIGLVVATLGTWVAARSFGIDELHAVTVAAVVVLLGALVWARLVPERLTAHRLVEPAALWFGQRTRVRLRLTNTGRFPTPPVQVRDQAPPILASRPQVRVGPLGPRRRVTVTYELAGDQRGRFTIGPLTVVAQDAFGLVQRRRTLPGTAEVTVYPPVVDLPAGLPLGGATGVSSSGLRRASAIGEDLADIREYVRGDDLRSVHWPSTAHRGKLMVRRSEDVLTPRSTIVLDVRRDRHTGHGPRASIETAVAAAASSAHHLAKHGQSVTVVDRPVLRAPSPRPWDAWLAELAETQPEDVDLPALLRQIASGAVGDGALLAIVTTPRPGELRALVRAGRAASTRTALVVDTSSHGGRRPDPATAEAVTGLRAAGWRATSLHCNDDLRQRWGELLGRGVGHAPSTGVS